MKSFAKACNIYYFILFGWLISTLPSMAQSIVIEDFTPKEICEGESIDITVSGLQLNDDQTISVLFPYSYIDFFSEVDTDAEYIDAEVINQTTIRTAPIHVYQTLPIPNDFLLNIQVEVEDEISENASIKLKVSPNAPPVIAGDACESNQLQSYQAFNILDNSIGQTYQWQVSDGNIVGKNDSSAVQVAWSNGAGGILSLQTTNDLGCISNLDKNIAITNNPDSFPLFLSSNLESNIADEQKDVRFTAFAEGAESYEFWVDDEIEQDASDDNTFIYRFESEGPSLTGIAHHLIRVVAEKDGICEEATLYIEVVQHPLGRFAFLFDALGGVKGVDDLLNANEFFKPLFDAYPPINTDIYEVEYFGSGIVFNGNDNEYYFNPGLAGDESVTIIIRHIHKETNHRFNTLGTVLDLTGVTDFYGITSNDTICRNEPPSFISPDFVFLSDEGFDLEDYDLEGVKVRPIGGSGETGYLEGDENPLTEVAGADSLVYEFNPAILPAGKYFIDVVMKSLDFDYTFSAGYIIVDIQDVPSLPTIPETIFYCADQLENFRIGAFGNTIRWYESEDAIDPIRIDDSLSIVSISNLKDTTIVFVTQQPGICESNRLKVDLVKNPVPMVAFDVDGLCEGEIPVFTNNTVIPEGIEVVEWRWNFGDGSQSNLKNPGLHNYANNTPGTIYNVTLEVMTTQGCELQRDTTVAFQANAKPIFHWYNTCQNNLIQFEIPAAQQIPGAQWMWDFGDGTSGEGVAPVHKYSEAAIYDVSLTVASDAFCSDNVSSKIFVLQQIELENEYINDFEEEANGWIAVPTSSGNDWEWGVPAGQFIDDTHGNVWITRLSETYTPSTVSRLDAPCLDLSNLKKPMVQLNYWSNNRLGIDGTVLQFAFGSGQEWFVLGDKDHSKSINWYNIDDIVANPGNQITGQFGWSGKTGGWVNSRHSLDIIRGKENVRFRMLMASGEGGSAGLDGVAFDNFIIQERTKVVLVEHFASNNLAGIGSVYETLYPKIAAEQLDALIIQHHLEDEFNAQNVADNNVRALFYGIPSSNVTGAKVVLDGNAYLGNTIEGNKVGWADSSLNHRVLKSSLFDINIDQFGITGNNLQISTTVRPSNGNTLPPSILSAMANNHVVIHTVVVEDSLVTPKGIMRNVVRKMLPHGAGSLYTNPTGQSFNESWTLSASVVNTAHLNVIVFLQNYETREVYQTTSVKQPSLIFTALESYHSDEQLSLNIHPNPANDYLEIQTQLPNAANCEWQLSNMQGTILLRGTVHPQKKHFKVATQDLEEGMYYFTLFSGDKEQLVGEKVVILH